MFVIVFIPDVTEPVLPVAVVLVWVFVPVVPSVFAVVAVELAATAFATELAPAVARLLVTTVDVPNGSERVGAIVFVVDAVPAAMLACDGNA